MFAFGGMQHTFPGSQSAVSSHARRNPPHDEVELGTHVITPGFGSIPTSQQ
jgi:hypothetical protein